MMFLNYSKKIKLVLLFFLFYTIAPLFGQQVQKFTKQFNTPSGIYGYVKLSTEPSTVGFAYVWVQQDAVVVEGIRSSGQNFTGNSLSEYGISFPVNCSNCFFYADGQASMVVKGVNYYGNFDKGGIINLGDIGKTNQPVKFSSIAKTQHNNEQPRLGYSIWEKHGRVDYINIHKVKGAFFGKITRAVSNYNKDKKRQENYSNLVSQANRTNSIEQKISLYKQARQYANQSQKKDIENKLRDLNNRLNKEQLSTTENKTPKSTESREVASESKTNEKDDNYNSDRLSFYTPTSSESSINTQLQSQGYGQLMQGNYIEASTLLLASGDHYGALAASGIAFFDEIFKALKEARDNKIRTRTKRLKTTLDAIETDSKELSKYYNSRDIDKFTTLSYKIISKKIEALENGFDLIKSERSQNKGKYKAKMGEIWVDVFEQLNFTINNEFSSAKQKRDLLLEIPFLFQSSRKAINLYNAKVPNKEQINNSFLNVYSTFIKQNLHLYSSFEQLELFLMTPIRISDFENIGLDMQKFSDYFKSLPSHQQEKLFMGDAILHRVDIQKTPFIDNVDLDNKILFLLDNELDYHFKISEKITFKKLISSDIISTDIFDKKNKKLKNLKRSSKNLKTKIKADKLAYNKTYKEIVDEKYISRFLDSINSGQYNLEAITALDSRFKIFEGLDKTKHRTVVLWNKNLIPSFKKVSVILNDNKEDATEIVRGKYFVVDKEQEDLMSFKTNIYSNELNIKPNFGQLYFVEINMLKGNKEFYLKEIDAKKGIRLLGTLKDVNVTNVDQADNED